jgi:catechol 2,3-dioxygenase-like lactoylglutathione lyase family enzyme
VTPRINFVTLGVTDMARARAFYERLGLVASQASNPDVTFFDANGVVLGLFGHHALAEDAHVTPEEVPTFRGVSLAWNTASEAETDAIMAQAEGAGARIVKPAEKVFWGGYSGYFADPDGHLWEVAYNPFFPLDEESRIRLP